VLKANLSAISAVSPYSTIEGGPVSPTCEIAWSPFAGGPPGYTPEYVGSHTPVNLAPHREDYRPDFLSEFFCGGQPWTPGPKFF
jgi:hypothetical protein